MAVLALGRLARWGTLTKGLDALLQQFIFTVAALGQHAQIHGGHDLADLPGTGAGLVAAGPTDPAPTCCLPGAFLVGFPVEAHPPGIMRPPSFGQVLGFLLTPMPQGTMGEIPTGI